MATMTVMGKPSDRQDDKKEQQGQFPEHFLSEETSHVQIV